MGRKSHALIKQIKEGAYEFQFTSLNDLERTLWGFQERALEVNLPGRSLCDYFVFQHVPHNTFLQLSKIETSALSHINTLYFRDSQLLRIKMPIGRVHDSAVAKFGATFDTQLAYMHLLDDTNMEGSGLMEMENVSKQPDGCWGPYDEDYVTLTLEVGDSESSNQLVNDARLWLQTIGSHVTQVVTLKIDRNTPRITVQLWEAEKRELRKDRTDRPPRVFKRQEIEILLIDNVPIANGSLRLSFEKIFERPPRAGTNESDFIFSSDNLTALARLVWRRQNFIPRGMARQT
jgi:hypothetical protein